LPAHGTLVSSAELASALAQPNMQAIQSARAAVEQALRAPGTPEQMVARTREQLGHKLAGIPQYYLFGSTVAAYLAWLEAEGLAVLEFAGDTPIWRSR